jgi:hypothetical protein
MEKVDMPVNPVLNDFYGTIQTETEPTQEELQKTASLQLLVKIAEEENIDIDQLSDEELMEAYNELTGESEEDSEGAYEGDLEKEAQEKVAEADTMGRIMAHSFVNELREINEDLEKTARDVPGMPEGYQQFRTPAGGTPSKPAEMLGPNEPKLRRTIRRGREIAKDVSEGAKELGRTARFKGSYTKEVLKARGITGKRLATGAGIAAGITGAGVGGKKLLDAVRAKKEKTSYDQAVEERALQYLADAGLMYEDGSVVPPDALQKQAEDVDQAALQLLAEMGYPVE